MQAALPSCFALTHRFGEHMQGQNQTCGPHNVWTCSIPSPLANIQQQIHESLFILSALIILNRCRGRHMWRAQRAPKCTICPKCRRVGAAAIDPQFPRTYVIRSTLPPGNHYKQIRRRFCRRQRRNSCSKWRPFFRDQTPGHKR